MPILSTLPAVPSRISDPNNFATESGTFLDAMPDLQARLNHGIIGRRWPIKYDLTGIGNQFTLPVSSGVSRVDLELVNFTVPVGATPKNLSLDFYTSAGQHFVYSLRYTLRIRSAANDFTGLGPVGSLPVMYGIGPADTKRTLCRMYKTTSAGNSWIVQIEEFYGLNLTTPWQEVYYTTALVQLAGPLTKMTLTTIDNTSQFFSSGTALMSWL